MTDPDYRRDLARIEGKLDRVETAIVSLARMEERMVTLFKRMDNYDTALVWGECVIRLIAGLHHSGQRDLRAAHGPLIWHQEFAGKICQAKVQRILGQSFFEFCNPLGVRHRAALLPLDYHHTVNKSLTPPLSPLTMIGDPPCEFSHGLRLRLRGPPACRFRPPIRSTA